MVTVLQNAGHAVSAVAEAWRRMVGKPVLGAEYNRKVRISRTSLKPGIVLVLFDASAS
jgi:hypothetical protein